MPCFAREEGKTLSNHERRASGKPAFRPASAPGGAFRFPSAPFQPFDSLTRKRKRDNMRPSTFHSTAMNIKLILLTSAAGSRPCLLQHHQRHRKGRGIHGQQNRQRFPGHEPLHAAVKSLPAFGTPLRNTSRSGTHPLECDPSGKVHLFRKRAASPFPEKRLLNIQRLAVLHGTACSPGGGIDIVADGFHIPAHTADRMTGNTPKKGGDA